MRCLRGVHSSLEIPELQTGNLAEYSGALSHVVTLSFCASLDVFFWPLVRLNAGLDGLHNLSGHTSSQAQEGKRVV